MQTPTTLHDGGDLKHFSSDVESIILVLLFYIQNEVSLKEAINRNIRQHLLLLFQQYIALEQF